MNNLSYLSRIHLPKGSFYRFFAFLFTCFVGIAGQQEQAVADIIAYNDTEQEVWVVLSAGSSIGMSQESRPEKRVIIPPKGQIAIVPQEVIGDFDDPSPYYQVRLDVMESPAHNAWPLACFETFIPRESYADGLEKLSTKSFHVYWDSKKGDKFLACRESTSAIRS